MLSCNKIINKVAASDRKQFSGSDRWRRQPTTASSGFWSKFTLQLLVIIIFYNGTKACSATFIHSSRYKARGETQSALIIRRQQYQPRTGIFNDPKLLRNRRNANSLIPSSAAVSTISGNAKNTIEASDDGDERKHLLENLNVVISGAGPSGLLVAHLLLQRGARVAIYESRPDPRDSSNKGGYLAGFAYALGLGIRGRSAIQRVDSELWQAVRQKGNECDRFRLHVGPLNIKLRDSSRPSIFQRLKRFVGKNKNSDGKRVTIEPSLLLYQADLCISLMDELERRYCIADNEDEEEEDAKVNAENNTEASKEDGENLEENENEEEVENKEEAVKVDEPRFSLHFQSRVGECDLERKRVILERKRNETVLVPYDLLVGCDGVNSIVRNAMKKAAPKFAADKQTLPGEFKVARLDERPPKLDPNSVALMIPKSGSVTAFMEPTVNGSSCILFAGRGGADNPILSSYAATGKDKEKEDSDIKQDNRTATLAETLLECFPLLGGADLEALADQLIAQKPGSASSVVCNAYHYNSSVAIAGDAAHATGGVSGQGVNSALLDSVALSDCLEKYFDAESKEASLAKALLAYSTKQVPEGKALYDLSFGPKPTGFKKLIYTLRAIRDTLFQGRFGIGRPPLQTLLTTSVEPFSSIRRKLNFYYDAPFPDSASFDESISGVYASGGEEAATIE